MIVYVGGKPLNLRDDQAIGKGGEADVFTIVGGDVLKLYKQPEHPDYAGNVTEQKGAKQRLLERQEKLPAFPKTLPPHVVAPKELAFSTKAGGKVLGYTMPFLSGTEPLIRFGEKSFRQTGITDETVIGIFRDLHQTVAALHDQQMVIGDFNDLNVLVRGKEAYVIDADSMQFGPYLCRVFTGKFVDPLLCDPKATSPLLVKPHNALSDWYAYLVMLMQSLTYVGPYGGVFKGMSNGARVSHDARPLHRITVWHPDVRYPKPAKPLNSLPDTVLDYLQSAFAKDVRGIPPLSLLQSLQFDKAGNLLVTIKPAVTPSIVKEVVVGTVRAEKVFDTTGQIMYASYQGGKLRWLYHDDGKYKRETGKTIIHGPLSPNIHFRIAGDKTVIAQGAQAAVFTPDVAAPEKIGLETLAGTTIPLIDANEHAVFFTINGQLKKTSALGVSFSDPVGSVLPNQTLFWTGDKLGFGFYRAGQLARYFVFDPSHRGINDTVDVPPFSGQMIDATCVFGKEKAWLFLATREGSKSINRCHLITAAGKVIASAESQEGDGSWLGSIRGKCAINDFLLSPTDDGIQKVQPNGAQLVVTKEYPDTARFVDSDCSIFPHKGGLSVIHRQSVWNLSIS